MYVYASLVFFSLSGCVAPVPSAAAADVLTTYTFDSTKSQLYVQVFKDATTLSSDLSHDHVVLATGWSGTAKLSPTNATDCSVDVRVPVSGLRPDLPELRQKVGYAVMLTDAQRTQVAEHMVGEDQLDVAKFTEIRFRSTSCSGTAADRKVNGELSIRGVTKAVQIPLRLTFSAGSVRATGTFTMNHADFGFEPYSALFGTLKNQEQLRFTLDVVGAG